MVRLFFDAVKFVAERGRTSSASSRASFTAAAILHGSSFFGKFGPLMLVLPHQQSRIIRWQDRFVGSLPSRASVAEDW